MSELSGKQANKFGRKMLETEKMTNTEDNLRKDEEMIEISKIYNDGLKAGQEQAKAETLKKVFEDEFKFLNDLRTYYHREPNMDLKIRKRIEKLTQKLKDLETKE
jgi:hypothetical protein